MSAQIRITEEMVEAAAKAMCREHCSMTDHWNSEVGCNHECRSRQLDLKEARAGLTAALSKAQVQS